MSDWNILSQAVNTCIERAYGDVIRSIPSSEIAGWGVLTDDDLSGVFITYCTIDEVTTEGDDFLFTPNDWENRTDHGYEQAPSDVMLKCRDKTCDSMAYMKDAFAALVEGAVRFRESGKLENSAYLMVGSTDPSPVHQRWEDQATARLNSPATVERIRRWNLEGARKWLETVRRREPPRSWGDEDLIIRLEKQIQELEVLLSSRG